MKLTKEKVLKNLEDIVRFGGLTMSSEFVESVRIAMEAYEQEPCEDCISRQAVIDITAETGALETQRRVMNLPPVQPKAKAGKWIMKEDNTSFVRQLPRRWAECSCCGWSCDIGIAKRYNYCPDCGAKMEDE